jgi:hypothetical protein
MNWPERATVVRETAKNATRIRKAFDKSINATAIAKAWVETHPEGGKVEPQIARDWALAQVIAKKQPLELALSRLYADGYTLGNKIAKVRVLNVISKGVSAGSVDWARWVPGAESAAALVRPTGGLKELLRTRKVSITDEITRTKIDRIGTSLARSLERGEDAFQTAKGIQEIVNDPQHALMIARTEMARAMSVATRETYESNNVQQVEWLVADGCDVCLENADASPIGIDETFPSGDSEPPAHPNCECAIAPVFEDVEPQPQEDEEVEVMEPYGNGPEELFEDVADRMERDTVARYQNQDYGLMNLIGAQNRAINSRWKIEEITDEGSALVTYKSSGYDPINKLLRGRGGSYEERFKDELMGKIKNIDKVINAAPPLQRNIMTYRGMTGFETNKFLQSLDKGDIFEDKAFVSTTLDKNMAEDWVSNMFGTRQRRSDGWVLEIQNPAGTKGLMLDGLLNDAAQDEAEWLLPRKSRFEVISIDKNTKDIKVRVVNGR